ncbi:hypothetical protein IAG44_04835 [Streptomyces roseirectus]|uniref:Uncharacterized protein n=1 Tax=Streptomyces roseirectus TaxID=2768066 RepID=A0A7H0I7S8_9ACTN|nr:hypothetical protein [Streptomyces roseirectus]QNP68844.1 hypothetical protein IAG44_04835 [Streptomyces roseirectus]
MLRPADAAEIDAGQVGRRQIGGGEVVQKGAEGGFFERGGWLLESLADGSAEFGGADLDEGEAGRLNHVLFDLGSMDEITTHIERVYEVAGEILGEKERVIEGEFEIPIESFRQAGDFEDILIDIEGASAGVGAHEVEVESEYVDEVDGEFTDRGEE